MKIGWASEMSSGALRSGSKAAAVSSVLVPQLRRYCDVRVYDEANAGKIAALEAIDASDIVVFQLEDRPANIPFREALAVLGGIAWCHDWFERDSSSRPEIRGVLDSASKVLFSSARNLAEYRLSAGRRADYLPYPAPTSAAAPRTGRTAIACCGSPLAEDQLHDVLAALRAASPKTPVIWLVSPDEEAEAARLRSEFPELAVELRADRSPESWRVALGSSALAVHLHFSAYGDPGPLFPITLMSGVPAVVSDFGEWTELDPAAFLRVVPGDRQRSELEKVFRLLDESSLNPIAERARALAAELFDSRRTAGELVALFESVRSGRIQADLPDKIQKREAWSAGSGI